MTSAAQKSLEANLTVGNLSKAIPPRSFSTNTYDRPLLPRVQLRLMRGIVRLRRTSFRGAVPARSFNLNTYERSLLCRAHIRIQRT
jgi:hypothetical protein